MAAINQRQSFASLQSRHLFTVLDSFRFTNDDIQSIAAQLGLDPDQLGGGTKTDHALSLIRMVEARDLTRTLRDAMLQIRPEARDEIEGFAGIDSAHG